MFNVRFNSLLGDLDVKIVDDTLVMLNEEGRVCLKLSDDEYGKLMFVISSYLQDKGK